jgi:hypothetical protein
MIDYAMLPPWERARRYRELAAESDRLGAARDDSLRAHYRQIAELWRGLAEELEEDEAVERARWRRAHARDGDRPVA